MKSMVVLLDSLLLMANSLSPSFKESYGIILPTHIDLSNSGSFQISLSEETTLNKDSIIISVDDNFELTDTHGKPSIMGTISNNEISFTSDDDSPKDIYYSIDNVSAGNWQGNLNLDIEVISINNENKFQDGPSVQKKFSRLKPTKITFTHDVEVSGTYTYDLSLDQDSSILLYRNGTEITITNMKNEKFKANENMATFFKGLSNLTVIENLDYIDMSTCTNMNSMFFGCSKLESIDASSFDVSNVTNMAGTFDTMGSCVSLGDLSNWNVSNVTTFQRMFNGALKLREYGDVGKWRISNKCTNIANMFSNCSYTVGKLNSSFFTSTLDLRNWDVSNITDMSGAFRNASNLETIDISTWNCQNVTNMSSMFSMENTDNVSKLTNVIGIDNLNVPNADKTQLFNNCNNLSLPTWYQ